MDIFLIPGYNGQHCSGNGLHKDASGNPIELQCDECDYFICCFDSEMCDTCFAENGVCEINARYNV